MLAVSSAFTEYMHNVFLITFVVISRPFSSPVCRVGGVINGTVFCTVLQMAWMRKADVVLLLLFFFVCLCRVKSPPHSRSALDRVFHCAPRNNTPACDGKLSVFHDPQDPRGVNSICTASPKHSTPSVVNKSIN